MPEACRLVRSGRQTTSAQANASPVSVTERACPTVSAGHPRGPLGADQPGQDPHLELAVGGLGDLAQGVPVAVPVVAERQHPQRTRRRARTAGASTQGSVTTPYGTKRTGRPIVSARMRGVDRAERGGQLDVAEAPAVEGLLDLGRRRPGVDEPHRLGDDRGQRQPQRLEQAEGEVLGLGVGPDDVGPPAARRLRRTWTRSMPVTLRTPLRRNA